MFLGLGITCKKADNIIQQITQCESDLNSQISMIPFLMIEERISQIYESRISTRPTVPTAESLRIVDIIKMAVECLKDYFPLDAFLGLKDYVSSVREYKVHELLLSCVKLLRKNYFGYLLNMDKRGLAELRWFTPKLREILELPIFSRTGQSTANITYLFSEELDEMEKILRGRQK